MRASEKTLRFHLDAVFNNLFPKGDLSPDYFQDLKASKLPKKLPRKNNFSVAADGGALPADSYDNDPSGDLL
jgi:hypothetical protein